MRELRLIPAAALVWAVTLAVVLFHEPVAWALVGGAVVIALVLRSPGQALVMGPVGLAACVLGRWRVRLARAEIPEEIRARVAGEPRGVGGKRWLVPVRVEDYPAQVPLFVESEQPITLSRGSLVMARVHWNPSDKPGLSRWVGTVREWQTGTPRGIDAWVADVHERFIVAVREQVGEASQGLIPGMVLGNTTAQGEAERELYLSTGLSHLSAVSGTNVTIVATCVFLLCRLCSLGPRLQLSAAVLAVVVFFVLVGPEPSVLRATLTGLVGLLAVAHSATFPPLHGLSVAVIVLLLYDASLATQWGFVLSVAATAGIVVLYPLLYRWIAGLECGGVRLPDVLVRALAVAVAADVTTAPLVAAMSGRVSLVSVLANLMVSPAVAPITIGGLMAVAALLLPGRGEAIALWVIEPCAWWIHHAAQRCAALPLSTVEATPAWVVVAYAWIAYLVVLGHGRKVVGVLCLGLALGAWSGRRAPPVDMASLRVAVVDTEEEAAALSVASRGEGSRPQMIVVRDGSGQPADYPTQTAEGIPVLFPERDGQVTLHGDGTQHAADGRF
ncbi:MULTISPECIES: ComEC/Rec2 family competence protein [unclassified Corynebacterium]|uniref:ComEC/Rec2 family competence protein n=1 Tax=unclassified Corynebacterium TaxID=2624378 RepID=UPI0029CA9577|nr:MULTISPECIES: ComEC/Rec2 family competence protein [unclassified Corynebacterium]WPF65587.1 ComEC/Rec2 family competence protein [Corynebacterium sp. 22KM0430]WPF68082.1 ComEC/Rec2 family competence protein [Corynebacterium sp. 21KM1197]